MTTISNQSKPRQRPTYKPRRQPGRAIRLGGALTLLALAGWWLWSNREIPPRPVRHQVSLAVQGMDCDVWCPIQVRDALQSLEGVDELAVNVTEGRVTVHFDAARISAQQLADCVERGAFECPAPGALSVVSDWEDVRLQASLDAASYQPDDVGRVRLESEELAQMEFGLRAEGELTILPSPKLPDQTSGSRTIEFRLTGPSSAPRWLHIDVTWKGETRFLSLPIVCSATTR